MPGKATNGQVVRILSVEDIFAAPDLQEQVVQVPQWGGAVKIKTFTRKQIGEITKQATHRDRFTGKDVTDNDLMEALTFIQGVVEPTFTLEDYERLRNEKSIGALMVIIKAINAASGLTEDAVIAAGKSPEE